MRAVFLDRDGTLVEECRTWLSCLGKGVGCAKRRVGLGSSTVCYRSCPREGAGTRRRGRVGMSALKTLALVVLAVILGSVTTELLAGGSALVWLVASALWTWLLLRGHQRQETHEE